MKNLVMGVAKGYGWDMLEPFVVSFEKNCRSAELVLFVDDISEFTRDRLIQAGVLLKNFPDDLKRGIPNNTRWKIFSAFLETHGDAYEQIFITDTRDVIFQADVFASFKDCQNYLGLTTEADDIRGSKTGHKVNYDWLVDCFGEGEADKLLDKKIICDGTVIGTTAEMKTFAEKMWQAVSAAESRVNFRIHDQAVANYLAHNNLLPIENLIEIDVDGEIFTAALAKDFSVQGEKILRGGRAPAVVHQYDRHKEMLQLADSVYRDKDFRVVESFNDMRSTIEQSFCLLKANKSDETLRLFMKMSTDKMNIDENTDCLLKLWNFALQRPMTPSIGFIELSIQAFLQLNRGFNLDRMNKICLLLIYSLKSDHAVAPGFKKFFANFLLNVIDRLSTQRNFELCFHFIDAIKSFELSLDANFYLLLARTNRLCGKKEEALSAYKKALDLS